MNTSATSIEQIVEAKHLNLVKNKLALLGRPWQPSDLAEQLSQLGYLVSDNLLWKLIAKLRADAAGLGPIADLLETPGITDVLINGAKQVWVDSGQGLKLSGIEFESEPAVRQLAVKMASTIGRRLDDSNPWVDARLQNGTRMHAVLSPIAKPGTCVSFRIPANKEFSLEQMVAESGMPETICSILVALVEAKVSFLVSGGTGSGKTTLLNAMLGKVAADERIVIIEDFTELNPPHPHVVRLEAKPANIEGNGEITMTSLVKQALRMRPDRIVVGEIRGSEIADLLCALNTGHQGGCATVHANSIYDIPARLQALAMLTGMSAQTCDAQTRAALQAVIHLNRTPSGKRVVSQIGVFENSFDPETGRFGALRVELAVRAAEGNIYRGPGWDTLTKVVDG